MPSKDDKEKGQDGNSGGSSGGSKKSGKSGGRSGQSGSSRGGRGSSTGSKSTVRRGTLCEPAPNLDARASHVSPCRVPFSPRFSATVL
jgi:hypothetical protein